jgi:uncharacterized RDD family membrane protein YckC
MRRPDHGADEPLLFDLPLTRPDDGLAQRTEPPQRKSAAEKTQRRENAPGGPDARTPATGPRPAPLPLEPALAARRAARPEPDAPQPPPDAEPDSAEATGQRREIAGRRFAAGGADLLIHAAVIVGLLLGCRALGVQPALADWPPVLLFALTFSFLYSVVPLAFWGHTLGMAWAGLVSHNRDGEPLTFDQTARRWLGGLLTLALAGLPLLTALRGRTLSDLLSGSETYATERAVSNPQPASSA